MQWEYNMCRDDKGNDNDKEGTGKGECPFTSNISSLENFAECPVRNIGSCDAWRHGEPPNYDAVNAK